MSIKKGYEQLYKSIVTYAEENSIMLPVLLPKIVLGFGIKKYKNKDKGIITSKAFLSYPQTYFERILQSFL